jgi:hypothetical protein
MKLEPSFFGSWEAKSDRSSDAQRELLERVRFERKRSSRISRLVDEDDKPVLGFTTVLWEIEDMLSPTSRSFWKLELKQRRRGKRTVPPEIAEDICSHYRLRAKELYEQGAPAPKKTAIGELAKEYGRPDTTIREIIRRATRKKPRR